MSVLPEQSNFSTDFCTLLSAKIDGLTHGLPGTSENIATVLSRIFSQVDSNHTIGGFSQTNQNLRQDLYSARTTSANALLLKS